MEDNQVSIQVDNLFNIWHLHNINVRDIFSVEVSLQKSNIKPGQLALQDKLRPEIIRIYRSFENCQSMSDFEKKRAEIINLCEPVRDNQGNILSHTQVGVLDNLADTEKKVEMIIAERSLRSQIVIKLMLELAAFVDISVFLEHETICTSIIHIYRQKVAYNEIQGVKNILLSFVRKPGSSARADSQVLALTVLSEEFRDNDLTEFLIRILRNSGRGYAIYVQKEVCNNLALLAAREESFRTKEVCDAITSFLIEAALDSELKIFDFVKEQIANILPSIGDIMLRSLITALLRIHPMEAVQSFRSQKSVVVEAIGLFGDKGLAGLLSAYYEAPTKKNEARSIVMALRYFAYNNNKSYWDENITLLNGKTTNLLQTLLEIIEKNQPASDLASQILGSVISRRNVKDLLWRTANDNLSATQTRISCLWTLFRDGKMLKSQVQDLCKTWLESNVGQLEVTAAYILYLNQGDNSYKERVTRALGEKNRVLLQLAHSEPVKIMPAFRSMLKVTSQQQIAINLLHDFGHLGWNTLTDEFSKTQDERIRKMILNSFLKVPSVVLRNYEDFIDRACVSKVSEERTIAERLKRQMTESTYNQIGDKTVLPRINHLID
ncbi:MAG: hypothetical protein U0V02_07855 [Anaerolineales bacterium]